MTMTRTASRHMDRVLWIDQGKKARSRTRRPPLLLFAIPTLLVIVSSLFFVWSRIQVIELGYEISSALKEGRALAESNNKLRLEIATLKSYARIEKIATGELGMFRPRSDQVMIIR